MLPADICQRLSDAQLETVIYAGEAHSDHLAGSWTVDETFDTVGAAADGVAGSVRFRRGFMLGDGTGAGEAQLAGEVAVTVHHPGECLDRGDDVVGRRAREMRRASAALSSSTSIAIRPEIRCRPPQKRKMVASSAARSRPLPNGVRASSSLIS